jgi:hypothetical protein
MIFRKATIAFSFMTLGYWLISLRNNIQTETNVMDVFNIFFALNLGLS